MPLFCQTENEELCTRVRSRDLPVGCAGTLLRLVKCLHYEFAVTFVTAVTEHCLISIAVIFCVGPFWSMRNLSSRSNIGITSFLVKKLRHGFFGATECLASDLSFFFDRPVVFVYNEVCVNLILPTVVVCRVVCSAKARKTNTRVCYHCRLKAFPL